MMLTLTLAAGLLVAPEPQKEWVVELHGYTYNHQAKPEGKGRGNRGQILRWSVSLLQAAV
jgi:hypothetical protein